MEQILKQRLVGAVVLVIVGILFLPVLFEGVPTPEEPKIETTNIPPKPETGFNSRIIPLEGDAVVTLPAPSVTPAEPESAPSSIPSPAPASAPPTAPANAAASKPATVNKPAEKSLTDKSADKTSADQPTKPEKPSGGKKPLEQNQANKSPSSTTPAAPAKSRVPDKSEQRVGVAAWVVQLGSFSSEQNAKELETRLQKEGYAAFVEKLYASDGQKFRVRIGPELVRTKAQEVRDKVEKDMNLKGGIVVRYP